MSPQLAGYLPRGDQVSNEAVVLAVACYVENINEQCEEMAATLTLFETRNMNFTEDQKDFFRQIRKGLILASDSLRRN